MGQGRRQTERITIKQARSERAGSKRSGEEVNSPGSTRKDKLGKRSEMLARGKQDFAVSASESAA